MGFGNKHILFNGKNQIPGPGAYIVSPQTNKKQGYSLGLGRKVSLTPNL
jgi:hypothetical protein